MKRITTAEFVERAKRVFGDKYDYSKVDYKNSETKIIVICPEHSEFLAIPNNFIKGHGCPACSGRQRITTEIFINRASKIHSNRYDYSRAIYAGRDGLVCIICPIHGEFWQKAGNHLHGNGCPKCYATPKSSTEEFIFKAKQRYGEKYDYSKVDYKGNKTKVIIVCPTHGDWLVTPNNFLRGSECPKCYGTPKYTTEAFIEKAREKHGDKYDYSKVDYKGNKTKVNIICPIHGEFSQLAGSHLRGSGGPDCSGFFGRGERIRFTMETFLKRSRENHTTQYDYSEVYFKDSSDKVKIICPQHGAFWQSARYHAKGGNCPRCAGSYYMTSEDFVEKARLVHGDKYDYSKVKYKNYYTKVCIICPKHGEFWQVPNNHLFGAGCPTCPQSNLEGEMRDFLIRNHVVFEQEKGFPWLRKKRKLFLDFFLPEYMLAIECQGGQHFKPVPLFGGDDFFKLTMERDKAKNELCKEHGVEILYFSRTKTDADYPHKVFESYRELLAEIKRHKKQT